MLENKYEFLSFEKFQLVSYIVGNSFCCDKICCEAPHPPPGLQQGGKGEEVTALAPHLPLQAVHVPSLYTYIVRFGFVGLAYQGRDIVFRFIIEYSSLRDFGPLGNRSIFI